MKKIEDCFAAHVSGSYHVVLTTGVASSNRLRRCYGDRLGTSHQFVRSDRLFHAFGCHVRLKKTVSRLTMTPNPIRQIQTKPYITSWSGTALNGICRITFRAQLEAIHENSVTSRHRFSVKNAQTVVTAGVSPPHSRWATLPKTPSRAGIGKPHPISFGISTQSHTTFEMIRRPRQLVHIYLGSQTTAQ